MIFYILLHPTKYFGLNHNKDFDCPPNYKPLLASMPNRKNTCGRPKGTTIELKKKNQQLISDAQYAIIVRYLHEIEIPENNRSTIKSIFFRILLQEKKNFNLDNTFKFPYLTAISRIRRSSLKAQGSQCPLIHIEKKVIDLILCMSKIKRSLTMAEALHLINELTDETYIQKMLIKWKLDHNFFSRVLKTWAGLGRIGGETFSKEIVIC